MKISNCLIDTSAWLALINPDDENHQEAREYFLHLLSSNTRLITNNIIIDETIQALKSGTDNDLGLKFLNVIDESVLTINLKMDWISRRARKSALYQYLKSTNRELSLRHFFIVETVNHKKVDIIFSFDKKLRLFTYPVMPHS